MDKAVNSEQQKQWLWFLQLIYQGLNLITQGIKKEIERLKITQS